MNEYMKIFIDDDYPYFIDKYLNTKTMQHIKSVTQFCGDDYSGLYTTRFLYTRYHHSIVVALMTWHFTHDKKQTIAALLHDVGTPCFSHCIDYVFGDYIKQESAEKKTSDVVKQDEEILRYLEEDGISPEDLDDYSNYPILENKSPRLCTDRLDGVLHTCYIWLQTNTLDDIKSVYDDMIVLENEDGRKEIGFKTSERALDFVRLAHTYAKELRGNRDKYTTKYISEIVKEAVRLGLITLEDLYTKDENEICEIFARNFESWNQFKDASALEETDEEPTDFFWVSFDSKLRNTIPLVETKVGAKRIIEVSEEAREIYRGLEDIKNKRYAYVKTIRNIA